MKLGHISEVILFVEDMDAEVEFYRDKLGLAVTFPRNRDDYSNEYWVTFDTGDCTLALHGGGEGKIGQDSAKFVFEVDDVDKVRAELLSRGVEVGKIREAAPGILVCDGSDPEGHRFSIESRSE